MSITKKARLDKTVKKLRDKRRTGIVEDVLGREEKNIKNNIKTIELTEEDINHNIVLKSQLNLIRLIRKGLEEDGER